MKKYLQEKNLRDYFDLSSDYFIARKNKEFFEGVHYFVPPTTSKTKKAILWKIEAVENWLTGNQVSDELEELLGRV
ncbi:MAG: hypothetical protein M0R46_17595 [Candidatus Muirbacterium halophilum]|nr:hypothetical protein [Candidatus Muirbacterium halophilum]